MERYYIQQKSGEVFGPFETSFIDRLIAEGNLTGEEGISQDRTTWIPILSLPQFARHFQGKELRPISRRSESSRVSKKQEVDHQDRTVPYPSQFEVGKADQERMAGPERTQVEASQDVFGTEYPPGVFPPPVDDEDVTPPGDREATVWARPKAPGMLDKPVVDRGSLTDVTLPPMPDLPAPPDLDVDLAPLVGRGPEPFSVKDTLTGRPGSAFEELMNVLDRKSGLLQVPPAEARPTPARRPPGGPEKAVPSFDRPKPEIPELPAPKRSEEEFATPHGVRVVLPLPVESVPELPLPKRYGPGDSGLIDRDLESPRVLYPAERAGARARPEVGEISSEQSPVPPELPVPKDSYEMGPTYPGPYRMPEEPIRPMGIPPIPGGLPIPSADQSAPELPVPVKAESEGWGISDTTPELPALRPESDLEQEAAELRIPRLESLRGLPEEPELPAPREEFLPEPLQPADFAELPVRRAEQAELPTRKEGWAELPTPRIGAAELPVRRDGSVDLPTIQMLGQTGLPTRRDGTPELPTSRFGGTGLPTSSDWSSVASGVGARPTELPTARYGQPVLPEARDGSLVGEEGPEVVPTRKLEMQDIEAAIREELGTSGGARMDSGSPAEPYSRTSVPLYQPVGTLPPPGVEHPDAYAETLPRFEKGAPSPPPAGAEEQLFEQEVAAYALPTRERPGAAEVAPTRILAEQAAVSAELERPERRRAIRPAAARRSRVLPYIAVLGLLGLVWLGAMVLPRLFSSNGEVGDSEVGLSPAGRSQAPQVVTRAPVVDFALLMPGTFGDYVSFLQQAGAAADNTENRDLNAVARLVMGQALMAVQYGSHTALTRDIRTRAAYLTGSSDELQALAQGAYAAAQGDRSQAEVWLEPIHSGPNAPWAHLFLGLAELQRYRQALEQYQAITHPAARAYTPGESEILAEGTGQGLAPGAEQLAVVPTGPAPERPSSGPTEVPAGTISTQREEPVARPEAPVLDTAMEEHLAMAIRLSPDMIPAYYFQGLQAKIRGEDEQAVTSFRQALEHRPQHLPSVLALSEILFNQGVFSEARTLLGAALEFPAELSSERERSRIHQLLGQVAMARRESDEALEELKQAFYADPNNWTAVRQLGDLFFQTGRYDEAVEFFQPHAASGSANAEVLVALAHNRLGQGRTGGDVQMLGALAADLESAQVNFPADPRFPYYLGRVSQALNQFDQAETFYRTAIQRDIDFRPGYLGLVELARQSNEMEAALGFLDEAVTRGESSAAAEKEIGDAYLLLGHPELAMQAYQRAVQIEPHYIDARLDLARQLIVLGGREQLTAALQHLRTVENVGVDLPELQALFAQVQYGLGDLNQARDRMQRIAASEDLRNDPENLYLLGRIHFDIGELASDHGDLQGARSNFQTARENFTAAFGARREDSRIRFWEGRSYLAMGQADNALPSLRNAFEMSIREGAPSGEFRYWLGLCQETLGQYQSALESYLLVDRYDLEWALYHPEFYFHRGRLLAGLEHLRRAQRDLEWALILDRDFVEATYTLAEVFFRQQRYGSAVAQWLRSLEILPDQAEVHFRLGTTYIRMEDHPNAVIHLERARTLGYGTEQPELFRTLGFLYRDWPGGGRTGEAIESFTRYLDSGAAAGLPDLRIEIENQIRQLGGTL